MIKKILNKFTSKKREEKINEDLTRVMKLNPDKDMVKFYYAVIHINPKNSKITYSIAKSYLEIEKPVSINHYIVNPTNEAIGSMKLLYVGKSNFDSNTLNQSLDNFSGESAMIGQYIEGNPIAFILDNGNVYIPEDFFKKPMKEKSYYFKIIQDLLNSDLKKSFEESK